MCEVLVFIRSFVCYFCVFFACFSGVKNCLFIFLRAMWNQEPSRLMFENWHKSNEDMKNRFFEFYACREFQWNCLFTFHANGKCAVGRLEDLSGLSFKSRQPFGELFSRLPDFRHFLFSSVMNV